MPKERYLSDSQLTTIGRRYGSEDIAKEARETVARWRRDLTVLAIFGYGQTALDAFLAILSQHSDLLASRPEAVAEKKSAVVARDKQVAMGWAWIARVEAILGLLARTDQRLSVALSTAMPSDDVGLATGIRALATLLADSKPRIASDAEPDKRLAEVDALCAALEASPGAVHTARGQTVADTVQIDLYDGKLYTCMSDLNKAARAAIHSGDLRAGMHEYTFHHLKRAARASAEDTTPAPVTGIATGTGTPNAG